MFSFIFGGKKTKEKLSTPSSQIESLTDNARTPGDIETYIFTPPLKSVESAFRFWDRSSPKTSPVSAINTAELLNEKVIADLLAKYSVKTQPTPLEKRRGSSTSSEGDEASLTNLKSLKESLNRIARYNNKRKYDERLGFASTLAAKAEEIGRSNTIKFLLKVIDEQLANDVAEIKSLILPQLTTIAKYISKKKEGYESIIRVLLPVVQRLLMDPAPEVSVGAAGCLANIAEILTNDDRGDHILTIVLKLAHDNDSVESKVAAIQLLNKLATKFGKDLCEQFVAFELMAMADDPEQKVRKTTIQNFLKVCETVGTEYFVKKLLPIYQKLGKDPYWPVREAAVNILGNIAQVCPTDVRESLLVTIFKEFYNDVSRFVKKATLMQIGQFIYSLKGGVIPGFLVELYVSLADSKATSDEELVFHCAYTFPAVLLAVGMSEWPILKTTYKNLIKKNTPQIKTTMAASIHEIAKIVGPQVTSEELDPIVKGYLNDKSTLHLCLAHLHELLGVLDEKQRRGYLEIIQRIVDRSGYNWRLREIFASHAGNYAKLFDMHTVYKSIFPIMCNLLQDTVVQVRTQACKGFASVAIHLKSEPTYFTEAANFVLKLFASVNFRDRQTFLQTCEGFMCHEQLFDQYFLTQFLTLQKDKVVNVRVSLARILHAHMKSSGVLVSNVHIIRTIQLLQSDSAREVQESVIEASKECDKMNELEMTRQEELEKVQEAAAASVDLTEEEDEEMAQEIKRQENEKLIKNTLKVDEIEDSVNGPEQKRLEEDKHNY